jgi:anhydro-N-acetylmuramic acid kinase
VDTIREARHTASRRIAGLMSGTSLDGIDAVVAQVRGHGADVEIEEQGFIAVPYDDALRDLLRQTADPDAGSARDVAQLGVRLAHAYADAVEAACDAAGCAPGALDAVGMHGQTVQHVPDAADCAGTPTRSTLQLGSAPTLAYRLGVPVVHDFRSADMAAGGQGAPLVPYFDHAVFSAADETRLLLNLGGIANVTVLPAGQGRDAVRAFDTGPGTMVIDALARRLYDTPYDQDGARAARGTVDNDWLADALGDAYFSEPPPKSTGRATFGDRYVDVLEQQARLRDQTPADTLATATMLTAASVYQAYARFVREKTAVDVVIAAGGGVHNDTLMANLADNFAPIPVRTTADYGLDPDAKEALCFAVLAHETLGGVPANVPSVTGAERPVLLGSITLPGGAGR